MMYLLSVSQMATENEDQKYCQKGEGTQTPISRDRNTTDVSVSQHTEVWSELKYNISIQIFLQRKLELIGFGLNGHFLFNPN